MFVDVVIDWDMYFHKYEISKVIFHNPATIVFWEDGTKTVVTCQEGDLYDREKGLALCFMKKALGNKGQFNEILKKYINYEPKHAKQEPKVNNNDIKVGDKLECISTKGLLGANISIGEVVKVTEVKDNSDILVVCSTILPSFSWWVERKCFKKVDKNAKFSSEV